MRIRLATGRTISWTKFTTLQARAGPTTCTDSLFLDASVFRRLGFHFSFAKEIPSRYSSLARRHGCSDRDFRSIRKRSIRRAGGIRCPLDSNPALHRGISFALSTHCYGMEQNYEELTRHILSRTLVGNVTWQTQLLTAIVAPSFIDRLYDTCFQGKATWV